MSKRISFLCLLVLLGTAFSCSLNPNRTESIPPHVDDPENKSIVSKARAERKDFDVGLYYGIEAFEGHHAAIVFRLHKTGGYLYELPVASKIYDLEISDPNQIAFKVRQRSGSNISFFRGVFDSNQIVGKFGPYSKEIDTSGDTKSGSDHNETERKMDFARDYGKRERVTFNKLEISPSPYDCGGLYSSRKFNEEAGEIVGEELLLIPTQSIGFGVFSYDNGTFPYAFSTHIDGSTFKFEINAGDVKQNFLGSCSQSKLKISYSGEDANPNAEPWVLVKKQGLDSFLSGIPQ